MRRRTIRKYETGTRCDVIVVVYPQQVVNGLEGMTVIRVRILAKVGVSYLVHGLLSFGLSLSGRFVHVWADA